MSKYTIKEVFEKEFSEPIWKIEVDSVKKQIAIETRNPDSTCPTISVIDFDGRLIMNPISLSEKEWTLAGITNNAVVLKKISADSPVHPGICILPVFHPEDKMIFEQYQFVELFDTAIQVRHSRISSGFLQWITLSDRKIVNSDPEIKPLQNNIVYPIVFQHQVPSFIKDLGYPEAPWLSQIEDLFLFTFRDENNHYISYLSDKNQIFDHQSIIPTLEKKILTPYFQVFNQIFILSDNKTKILSYLV